MLKYSNIELTFIDFLHLFIYLDKKCYIFKKKKKNYLLFIIHNKIVYSLSINASLQKYFLCFI